MIYRYTCSICGLLVRIDHQADGKDIQACMCVGEIIEEAEEE